MLTYALAHLQAAPMNARAACRQIHTLAIVHTQVQRSSPALVALFQVTEPFFKEYARLDLHAELAAAGFTDVQVGRFSLFVCACEREHDCACLRVQFILVSLFANTNIRLIEFNESIGQVVPTDPKNRLVLARRATF